MDLSFPDEGIGALCFCGVHRGEMIHWMELGNYFVTCHDGDGI